MVLWKIPAEILSAESRQRQADGTSHHVPECVTPLRFRFVGVHGVLVMLQWEACLASLALSVESVLAIGAADSYPNG